MILGIIISDNPDEGVKDMADKKKKAGCLATIGNIIWFITGGLITGLAWLLFGAILCITIIGIPLGKQCFKIAKLSFSPFGKTVNLHYGSHAIANTIWLIFFGWELFIAYVISIVLNAITIIGIPSAIAASKFCKISLAPFGATVD